VVAVSLKNIACPSSRMKISSYAWR